MILFQESSFITYIYECFINYQQGLENIKMNNKEFLSSNIAIKIDKIISKL